MPLLQNRRRIACLLGLSALLGLAAPALAAQSILTFEGPTTLHVECFEGDFPGSGCVELPTLNVRYRFLLDTGRLGEQIIRDASGQETVTTFPSTQFARFLGQPVFADIGPVNSRITVEMHLFEGALHGVPPNELGGTITDSRSVFADLPGDVHFENRSEYSLTVSHGRFDLGSLYNTRQVEMIIDGTAVVREHRLIFDSDLTLTEIEQLPNPAPEPGTFLLISVSLVVLACLSFYSRRAAACSTRLLGHRSPV